MSCSRKAEILFFSAKDYDRKSFDKHNTGECNIHYIKESLSVKSFEHNACGKNVDAICVFVNDVVDKEVLASLKKHGVKAVLSRCAGFDRVDIVSAAEMGIQCARVPAYSPYAVAEMAVALLMTLNRKLHLANGRTSSGNFSIDGLTGFDLKGKTVGVIGTGKIGQILIDIMIGFGCKIAAFDVYVNQEYAKKEEVTYMTLDEVYACSDVISLHSPLLPSTKHMINKESIAKMKKGVILINCARGGLIDTEAVLDGIASKKIRGIGMDVYEHEAGVFFNDCSGNPEILTDRTLAALMSSPNALVTAHQAFLTEEALDAIATTTFKNVTQIVFENKKEKELDNWVSPSMATSG